MININLIQAQNSADILAAMARALKDTKQFAKDVEVLRDVYANIINATVDKQELDKQAASIASAKSLLAKQQDDLVARIAGVDKIESAAKDSAAKTTAEAVALLRQSQEAGVKLDLERREHAQKMVSDNTIARNRTDDLNAREERLLSRETRLKVAEQEAESAKTIALAAENAANTRISTLKQALVS